MARTDLGRGHVRQDGRRATDAVEEISRREVLEGEHVLEEVLFHERFDHAEKRGLGEGSRASGGSHWPCAGRNAFCFDLGVHADQHRLGAAADDPIEQRHALQVVAELVEACAQFEGRLQTAEDSAVRVHHRKRVDRVRVLPLDGVCSRGTRRGPSGAP